ncbi:MAG: YkgJ family cysteine cluster protein [Deltaproteobacteria bacterium]|jgi:Fe-S-cluster containining protein
MSENQRILGLEDTFHFSCNPQIDCFTRCCQNVNILLTPYDIIQMKNRLKISSTDFLKQYTKTLIAPETALPAVQFRMDAEKEERCYLVGKEGCKIYEHRPWSCRMYPLDNSSDGEGFSPMVDSSRCLGLDDNRVWRLRDWFEDQGLQPYAEWNQRFAEVTEDKRLTRWRKEYPRGLDIFYLACYDLDRFREVVFEEKLYEMLEQPPVDRDKLKSDDLALLEFAFTWLRTVAERALADR